MNEPEDTSPTGRNLYYAKSLKTLPSRDDHDCPFCAAGNKATPMKSVVEIDFSGVKLRVLSWSQKDVDRLVAALDEARVKDRGSIDIDTYVDPQTFATALGMPTMPVIEVPVADKPVKRKNAPKGKRGRAQWWNK